MRCVVQYFPALHPPLLQLSIHHAPHRRMHIASIQRYREDLQKALNAAAVPTPIGHPIGLSVLFVNPSSPDLDNLLTALYQALDGATLRAPGILEDDGLISKVTASKYFPGRTAQ